MSVRNVVTVAHVDPELHEWAKNEATRRSEEKGRKVPLWEVFDEALRALKGKYQKEEEPCAQSRG